MESEAKKAIDLIRSGEILTVSQVAEIYGLTPRTVQYAAKEGKLSPDEAVETSIGWLITRAGAERLWGYRKKDNHPG